MHIVVVQSLRILLPEKQSKGPWNAIVKLLHRQPLKNKIRKLYKTVL